MNIIGIDPSLTGTGWAVGDLTGTVTADGEDERLPHIYRSVMFLAEATHLAIIEDLPVHGHGAGKTGMAQGVIRLALQHLMVPYITVPPATVKKFATGHGNATKADMRMALYQRTGIDVRDDNQADAAWLRHLGYALIGLPLIPLPKTHLAALDKLPRPDLTTVGEPPA